MTGFLSLLSPTETSTNNDRSRSHERQATSWPVGGQVSDDEVCRTQIEAKSASARSVEGSKSVDEAYQRSSEAYRRSEETYERSGERRLGLSVGSAFLTTLERVSVALLRKKCRFAVLGGSATPMCDSCN
ncbi:hypothetical protein Acr_29g0002070 [Actinidia rufa]|uniref:Uncharacterized protein n=1 Tax=Actinidia rufa TaxID=165716 RepID=A0A7J0HDJ2_9ERIC|nr:hypothetical protein Acr_29g0002070 [Actinidia rufa]